MPNRDTGQGDVIGSARTRVIAGVVFLVVGAVVAVLMFIRATSDDTNSSPTASQGATTQPSTAPTNLEPPATTSPTSRRWPDALNFRPLFFGPTGEELPGEFSQEDHGLYLWADFEGWFIWSVGSERSPIELTVEVNGEIPAESVQTMARADAELIDPQHLKISIRSGGDQVAGVRFNPGFFTNSVRVSSESADEKIQLGAGRLPLDLPVEITKGQQISAN